MQMTESQTRTLMNASEQNRDITIERLNEDSNDKSYSKSLGASKMKKVDVSVEPESPKQNSQQIKADQTKIGGSNQNQSSNEDVLQKFEFHGQEFFFDKNSCYILSFESKLRRALVWLATWRWFHRFIILVLCIDCVHLAQQNYDYRIVPEKDYVEDVKHINIWISIVAVIYFSEFLVKVLAMGFVRRPFSYLRSKTNWIDFALMLICLLELSMHANLLEDRIFHVLRMLTPLRTIHMIPQSREIVDYMIQALPGIASVLLLQYCCFLSFAIIGVATFTGTNYYACRVSPELEDDQTWPSWPDSELQIPGLQTNLCRFDSDCVDKVPLGQPAICGSVWDKAGLDPVEYDDVNDNLTILYGIPSFDNVIDAYTTVIQIVTMESWVYTMYLFADTGMRYWALIYFSVLIIIGNFFVINLFLAQIVEKFTSISMEKKVKKDALTIEEKDKTTQKASTENKGASDDQQQISNHENSEQSSSSNESNQNPFRDKDSSQAGSEAAKESAISADRQDDPDQDDIVQQIIQRLAISVESNEIVEEDLTQQTAMEEQKETQLEEQKQQPLHESSSENLAKLSLPVAVIPQRRITDLAALTPRRLEQLQLVNDPMAGQRRHSVNVLDQESDQKSDQKLDQVLGAQRGVNETITPGGKSKTQRKQHDYDDPYAETIDEERARLRSHSNSFYRATYLIVTSLPFNLVVLLVIIANTVILAIQSNWIDREESSQDEYTDFFFVTVFTVEICLRIIGLGFGNWAHSKLNIVEAVIVIVCIVDFIVMRVMDDDVRYLKFFRCLRLLQFIRLRRYLRPLRVLLIAIWKSLKDVSKVLILIFLFASIFAMLGKQLFAYKAILHEEDDRLVYDPDEIREYIASGRHVRYPRANFNTFSQALMSVFIVMLQEDWNFVMYTWIRTIRFEANDVLRLLSSLFFLILVAWGQFLIMSLFTAVLLKNINKDINQTYENYLVKNDYNMTLCDRLKRIFKKKRLLKKYNMFLVTFGRKEDIIKPEKIRVAPQSLQNDQKSRNETQFEVQDGKSDKAKSYHKEHLFVDKYGIPTRTRSQRKMYDCINLIHYHKNDFEIKSGQKSGPVALSTVQLSEEVKEQEIDLNHQSLLKCVGTSLYIFGQDNKFRKLCWKVTHSRAFKIIIILLILVSCIPLVFHSPIHNLDSDLVHSMLSISLVTTLAFVLEGILKTIAQGFCCNYSGSYLRNEWNLLDFVVVVASVCDLTILVVPHGGTLDDFASVMRAVQLLRPLRLIGKSQELIVAIKSLIRALPSIFYLQSIVFFLMIILAILQTNLFSGTFSRCDTNSLGLSRRQELELIETKWDCLNYGGEWRAPDLNYDTFSSSLLTLFILQSTEGWIATMYDSADAVGIDMQPVQDHSAYFAIPYTIVLMVIVSLLFMNLFVGIVIAAFDKEKELMSFNHLLKPSQKDFIQLQLLMLEAQPRENLLYLPKVNKCRKCALAITEENWFKVLVNANIIVNVLALLTIGYKNSEMHQKVLRGANYICYGIFCTEFVIKLTAQQKSYFNNYLNKLDFILVFAPLVFELIYLLSAYEDYKQILSLMTVLRVVRILQSSGNRPIGVLFTTIVRVLPKVQSLGILMFLITFVYTVFCVEFFATVNLEHNGHSQNELGSQANFQEFSTAFMTMFRSLTGEAWPDIMYEMAREKDIFFDCIEGENYDSIVAAGRDPSSLLGPRGCGHPKLALAVHISFQIIVSQICLNLLAAIFIQELTAATQASKLPLTHRNVQAFVEEWGKLNPHGTHFLKVAHLPKLLTNLAKSRQGCKLLISPELVEQGDKQVIENYICLLRTPTYEKFSKVLFHDVLLQLCQLVIRAKLMNQEVYLKDIIQAKRATFDVLMILRNQGRSVSRLGNTESISVMAMDETFSTTGRQFDLEILLKNMKKMNPRVQLVRDFYEESHKLQLRFGKQVDTVASVCGLAEENARLRSVKKLYTTKHIVAAQTIIRVFARLRKQKSEENASKSEL